MRETMGRLPASLWLLLTVGGCALEVGCDGDGGGAAPPDVARFVDVAEERGLRFVHRSGATGAFRLPEIMAGGAALFDADNDGDLDAFLTNGGPLDGSPATEQDRDRLFLQGADGRFEDATERSGLGNPGYGMGVAVGDVDNDGDADLYLTNYGPDRLYANDGTGVFTDVTAAAGIEVPGWSASATFLDYDRDGHLDLFVTRYVEDDAARECIDSAGRPNYCGPDAFPAVADVLLHNNGDGTFVDRSRESGIAAVRAAGLGVVAEDFNDDGWPDIYVANDGDANHLWLNDGDGSFTDHALVLGAALDLHGRPEAGMGVIASDLDNDLDLDLFMTHRQNETNTFYRSRGAGLGFEDASGPSGLGSESLVLTGFGTAALDLELDGDLDLAIANGRVTRRTARQGELPDPWNLFAEVNQLFVNEGDGRFRSAPEDGYAFTAPVEVSRGLALGDVDGDGDLDLLVANIESRAELYLNETPREGHWLLVRAVDPRHRRDAIGARLTLRGGAGVQLRTVSRGFSYLSSHDPRAHFGLGRDAGPFEIEVRWPDGRRERFAIDQVDRAWTLERGRGEALP